VGDSRLPADPLEDVAAPGGGDAGAAAERLSGRGRPSEV
jgi:hypothetical protein